MEWRTGGIDLNSSSVRKQARGIPAAVAFLLASSMALSLALGGCALNITRHTDGPLTQYLEQPLPELETPIARTLSLEQVTYNTASSDSGTMIGDLVAREIYILPGDVGREVKALLQLDEAFDEAATRAALNRIAERRSEARIAGGFTTAGAASSGTASGSSNAYIQRHEERASEAYAKGDYLGGDISSSAAQSSLQIQQSAARTQAAADVTFAMFGAAASAGKAMITSEFNTLRRWIERDSGAIGAEAPAETHLSVFLLRYFDAKSFQLDSRMRVAAYLVLTSPSGSREVVEGSDILTCQNECDLYPPKATSKYYDETAPANEVQKLVSTYDGMQSLEAKGFANPGGVYQYVLLRHGLKKLAEGPR